MNTMDHHTFSVENRVVSYHEHANYSDSEAMQHQNPALTNFAREITFKNSIWRKAMPLQEAPARTFDVPVSDMKKAAADLRSISGRVDGVAPTILTRSVGWNSYTLRDRILATQVLAMAAENANAGAEKYINSQSNLAFLANIFERMVEYDVVGALLDYASYASGSKKTFTGQAGAYYWSDQTNGDPAVDLDAACEAARAAFGRLPNTIIPSANVLGALRKHPCFKTSNDTRSMIPLPELQGALSGLGLTNLVETRNSLKYDLASDAWTDAWTAGYCWIGFVPEADANPDFRNDPAFGYTFRLRSYPLVHEYAGAHPTIQLQSTADNMTPIVMNRAAGFLFKTCIAP